MNDAALGVSRPRIFLIDDDHGFLQATSLVLSEVGTVSCYGDARECFKELKEAHVVISDYKMKFSDGHELLRYARENGILAPIILISAYADKEMAIGAANLHTFAILEKPVAYPTLFSTVTRAVEEYERRVNNSGRLIAPVAAPAKEVCGIVLDHQAQVVTIDGKEDVRLTEIEFRILSALFDNIGERVSREAIQNTVWGSIRVAENALDTHLGNLKKKIPRLRDCLRVVRGKGYVLGE